MKVVVDMNKCQDHGQCVFAAPDVFQLDGNGRLARLLAVLMAAQAGITPLRLSALAGRGKRTYVQAIQTAMSRDYKPLESLFSSAIDGPWRHVPAST